MKVLDKLFPWRRWVLKTFFQVANNQAEMVIVLDDLQKRVIALEKRREDNV